MAGVDGIRCGSFTSVDLRVRGHPTQRLLVGAWRFTPIAALDALLWHR
jgi:hypothetical protein